MQPDVLKPYGWTDALASTFRTHAERGLVPGRILEERRAAFLVVTAAGETVARPAGALLHQVRDPVDLPCVGDWVALSPPASAGSEGVIRAVLPRSGVLVRKAADRVAEGRALASNLDFAFLVASADRDASSHRAARTLALLWESGAQPVVLLTKRDLLDDAAAAALLADLETAAPGVPVHAVSARDNLGMEALLTYLRPGTTSVLVGSSGAGKSTLVNRLLGEDRQTVNDVRGRDGRGMHTTTSRHLFLLPSGGALIDTPGIREVAVFGDGDGVDAAFDDIVALAEGCRFRDCIHEAEPGCAVRAAAETGDLDADRLVQWHHLRRESAFWHRKTDLRARLDEKRRVRKFGRIVNEAMEMKRRAREGG